MRLISAAAARAKSFGTRALSTGREVVVVSAVRTPIGTFNGGLAPLSATKLGASAVKSAMDQAGVSGDQVDEVYMGNVVSAGLGQAPARQAALFAGIDKKTPCTTINKVCASGMKAMALAAQNIALGGADVMVAGGMESMSNVPYYVMDARFKGYRYGHGKFIDGLVHDGLWDVYGDHHMGVAAEKCASDYSISREEQDAYAIESYRRSAAATEAGHFSAEIAPVTIAGRKGDKVISVDEEFTNVNLDKIPTLKPAFKKDGSVTAANASTLNDGASAVVMMSLDKAQELGLKPLAKIRSFADAAQEPVDFTTAPALAMPKAYKLAGIDRKDIDLYEINEAFSVVALANMKLLDIDPATINVNGGGVALGHPIGSSGCRIMVTLIHALQRTDKTIGAAGICNGGGGAGAMVVERI